MVVARNAPTKLNLILQGRGLYVSDTKALHHVIVKELAIFQEPRWFVESVFQFSWRCDVGSC